ncbi:Epidermal growth factor-like domain [Macleaya cordata]|uniref:Epidermal growth factor-like domain n=1 Tax=Macleaya cordata TaxID=56857 RepID=A0A200QU45_MACCD|nr:Epidermal growth factor-like domain [Macleaya cordata]
MSLSIESDVDIVSMLPHFLQYNKSIKKLRKSMLPIICFRDGSPPVPDVSESSLNDLVLNPLTNDSIGGVRDLQKVERCHLLQKNIMLSLTNEQISPGVLYVGLFNGIGPIVTQSKMISRGSSYSFSAKLTVEGCTTSTMWGPYCNQTIDSLSCAQSDGYKNLKTLSDVVMYNQTVENVISCRNTACHGYNESKVYSLDIIGMANQLMITAMDSRLNKTPSMNNTESSNGTLMFYARHGAMPSITLHDYSSQISKAPLIIPSPKIGRWYIAILPINQKEVRGSFQENKTNIYLCYSLDWQVHECPVGKAGANCTWRTYALQTVLRKDPYVPFASYYLPNADKMSPGSVNFPLEPLLSNSSFGDKFAWTYFLLDIPYGAAGGHIHIQLRSDAKINYEIYSRFGGLPSLDTWDYYYANSTSSSNGSMFFKLYDSSDGEVSFYILYASEGTWSFGLRHLVPGGSHSNDQTTMSIAIERCPKRCSGHGVCKSFVDASGLTLYSYCDCDRDHGGVDCSIVLVDHKGHIQQSIALIASNAAAILPAFWALRQKAFAEWVLFTTSGISSALYHACDVGTWCALSFRVLQFMDFWLSFMAVVSNFVYLATIDEVSKRVIHTCMSILTALMAATGATRSSNIILVISIGAAGLLIGWLIEYSTTIRSRSCSTLMCLNIIESQMLTPRKTFQAPCKFDFVNPLETWVNKTQQVIVGDQTVNRMVP